MSFTVLKPVCDTDRVNCAAQCKRMHAEGKVTVLHKH